MGVFYEAKFEGEVCSMAYFSINVLVFSTL